MIRSWQKSVLLSALVRSFIEDWISKKCPTFPLISFSHHCQPRKNLLSGKNTEILVLIKTQCWECSRDQGSFVVQSSWIQLMFLSKNVTSAPINYFMARGPKKKVTLIIETYIVRIYTCHFDVMHRSSLPGAIVIERHLFNIDEQAGSILNSTKSILMSMSSPHDNSVHFFSRWKFCFRPHSTNSASLGILKVCTCRAKRHLHDAVICEKVKCLEVRLRHILQACNSNQSAKVSKPSSEVLKTDHAFQDWWNVINDDIYRSFENSLFSAGLDTLNSSHVQQLNERWRQENQKL